MSDAILLESLAGLASLPSLVAEIKEMRREIAALREGGRAKAPTSTSRYLTLAQAAQELNYCEKTVRRLIGRGLLQRSKGTRHIRIPFEAIEEYKRRTV